MKKICLLLVLCLMLCNVVFASVSSEDKTLRGKSAVKLELKDPKIINIPKINDVDSKSFNQKILNDKKKYAGYKSHMKKEYYNLYSIFDKVIRANNLQSQNWRLAIVSNLKNINASAGASNLVIVNTSLYDCVFQDENALAFIICHEIAHLILGHNQISLEDSYRIQKLELQIQKMHYKIRQDYESASAVVYLARIAKLKSTINKICQQEQELEYIADSEAISLMLRAGFDVTQIQSVLNLLSNIPNVYTNRSTHPPMSNRILNIKNEIDLLDVDYLTKEGRRNLLNSDVSAIKTSSDKKTLVILSKNNMNKVVYTPQTTEDKLASKAYICYLNEDISSAKYYFQKLLDFNQKSYIAPLYLSYIFEYEYLCNNNKEDLKAARDYAKMAYTNNPSNKYVLEQREDIIDIYKNLKKNKSKDK